VDTHIAFTDKTQLDFALYHRNFSETNGQVCDSPPALASDSLDKTAAERKELVYGASGTNDNVRGGCWRLSQVLSRTQSSRKQKQRISTAGRSGAG